MSVANVYELQMLALINQERTSRGLNALELEQNLNASAEEHSKWMLETNTFSHTGIEGSSAGDRMRAAGFDFAGSWANAENIGWQSERGAAGIEDDVVNLHNALMDSPGHRANILNPDLQYVGIGIEIGDFDYGSYTYDTVMVTQNFAKTSGDVLLDPQTGGTGDTGASLLPNGTSGADTVVLAEPQSYSAGAGNDTVTGSDGADEIHGDAGRDVLSGGKGEDKLYGGGHADALSGGAGADTVLGGKGDDALSGGKGRDLLKGGFGDDVLNGHSGNDKLVGGSGADLFVFSSGRDKVRDFDLSEGDQIQLDTAAGINDFADLVANHMVQDGTRVIIEDADGNEMWLQNTDMDDLSAADFLF